MPDIVRAFQHACMLRNHNLQFEDAKHEETSLLLCAACGGGGARRSLQVSGHKGGREGQEKPLKFLDANTNKAALRTQYATGDK